VALEIPSSVYLMFYLYLLLSVRDDIGNALLVRPGQGLVLNGFARDTNEIPGRDVHQEIDMSLHYAAYAVQK
jgi:hypothetical protein